MRKYDVSVIDFKAYSDSELEKMKTIIEMTLGQRKSKGQGLNEIEQFMKNSKLSASDLQAYLATRKKEINEFKEKKKKEILSEDIARRINAA